MPDRTRSCNAGLASRFKAEIDLTSMGGIERGKRNPSMMARIADALGVQLPKLLSN